MIATGIVVDILPNRNHTILRHSHCRVEVKWYKNELPPKVKVGAKITVLGKVMTFSNGRSFQLLDTVMLKQRPRAIQAAIAQLLAGLVVEPKTYLNAMDDDGHVVRDQIVDLP
jgi:hypothetical protein